MTTKLPTKRPAPKQYTQEQKDELIAKADFNLKSARIALQEDFPFFYDVLFFMDFKPVFDESYCPTMGVNVKGNAVYSPDFVLQQSKRKLMGTLIHESSHIAYLHVLRGMTKHNKDIWNLAIDCHANTWVLQQKLELPDEIACIPNLYDDSVEIKLLTPKGEWKYKVAKVSERSSESIYEELLKAGVPQPPRGGSGVCDGHCKPGDGDPNGNGVCTCGLPQGGLDKHDYTGDGRELTPEEQSREEEKWKQITINAAERAKQMGKLPGGMERFLDKLLQPKIDWKNRLYNSVVTAVPSGNRT